MTVRRLILTVGAAALVVGISTPANADIVAPPQQDSVATSATTATTYTAAKKATYIHKTFTYGGHMKGDPASLYTTKRFRTAKRGVISDRLITCFYFEGPTVAHFVTCRIQLWRMTKDNFKELGKASTVLGDDASTSWVGPKGTYFMSVQIVGAQRGIDYMTTGKVRYIGKK